MQTSLKEINAIINEAKKFDNEDNFVKAVSLYQEAAHKFLAIDDFASASLSYTKAVQILKREAEFYKSAMLLRKLADLYKERSDYLNAGRQYSRSGTLFMDVKEFQEGANSYRMAGEMFYTLKGEFYAEAGKHYKMSTICLINFYQHQHAEYEKVFNYTVEAFKTANVSGNISRNDYLLYIINFFTDVQDALTRNGIFREEGAMYIKKMDAIREMLFVSKRNWMRYGFMSLWKWTCDYGESVGRWIMWVCIDIIFFAVLHYFSKSVINPAGKLLNPMESLFFAVNFFTTNGFGGYTLTNGLAKFIAAFNILTGVAMTAVLITIIARKITR